MGIKYKMRFTGQATDAKTGHKKEWSKGDVVEGEFDQLLPDTFKIVKENTMIASGKPKPVTKTRRRGRRKVEI